MILHPKESCLCPSNATCYHILAARLSIGETGNDAPKKKINLTQLFKNARGKRRKSPVERNQGLETIRYIQHLKQMLHTASPMQFPIFITLAWIHVLNK